jgi:hypothetical protein
MFYIPFPASGRGFMRLRGCAESILAILMLALLIKRCPYRSSGYRDLYSDAVAEEYEWDDLPQRRPK